MSYGGYLREEYDVNKFKKMQERIKKQYKNNQSFDLSRHLKTKLIDKIKKLEQQVYNK